MIFIRMASSGNFGGSQNSLASGKQRLFSIRFFQFVGSAFTSLSIGEHLSENLSRF